MNLRILELMLLVMSLPLAGKAEFKVLFIGNSFTFGSSAGDSGERAEIGGGVPGIFDRLAQAGGQADPTTVKRVEVGADFQLHDTNAATLNAILSQPWTHVVLQNYSTEPTHYVDASHSIADHMTYGSSLYQRILSNSPTTQVFLYETWSRAAAHPIITGVSGLQSFASTAQMQLELRTNYANLAAMINASHPSNPPVMVVPVGDAWENAGGLRPASDPQFVDLFASENYHGNDNGYYLAAAVFYSTIYGANPHGLGSNPLISSLNLNLTVPSTVLEDIAWTTVQGTNSPPPPPPPPPALRFESQNGTNGELTLVWTGNRQLDWAPSSEEGWIPIPGATNSPYSIRATNTSGFFRLEQIPP